MFGSVPRITALACSAGLSLVAACTDQPGIPPVPARLEFPIAARLIDASGTGADPTHLVVLNSNFYLRYNAGTLQSYDYTVLGDAVATQCPTTGVDPEFCAIVPTEAGYRAGPLGNLFVVPTDGLLVSEVKTGSFGEGIAVAPDARHLYLPIRSDEDVTRVDFGQDGTLACGNAGEGELCDRAHRRSNRGVLKQRDLALPNEPLDLHVGDLSDFGMAPGSGLYLASAHRSGKVSFFAIPDVDAEPVVTDVVGFESRTFSTLTFEPRSRTFWLPTVGNSLILRATVSIDATTTDPSLAVLRPSPAVSFTEVDLGRSTASLQQVAFDPRPGLPYEDRIYLLSLRPAALVLGRNEVGTNQLAIDHFLPLGAEPSRVTLVELGGRMLAFVSCFLSREIYIYDVDSGRLVSMARGMNGPFELMVDSSGGQERLLVVDFRVSVIRFFDLAPLVACLGLTTAPTEAPQCAPRMIGMLGVPSTVEELR